MRCTGLGTKSAPSGNRWAISPGDLARPLSSPWSGPWGAPVYASTEQQKQRQSKRSAGRSAQDDWGDQTGEEGSGCHERDATEAERYLRSQNLKRRKDRPMAAVAGRCCVRRNDQGAGENFRLIASRDREDEIMRAGRGPWGGNQIGAALGFRSDRS